VDRRCRSVRRYDPPNDTKQHQSVWIISWRTLRLWGLAVNQPALLAASGFISTDENEKSKMTYGKCCSSISSRPEESSADVRPQLVQVQAHQAPRDPKAYKSLAYEPGRVPRNSSYKCSGALHPLFRV